MTEQSDQKVEYIPVQNLVLWTENPRDTISSKNKNVIPNLFFVDFYRP